MTDLFFLLGWLVFCVVLLEAITLIGFPFD